MLRFCEQCYAVLRCCCKSSGQQLQSKDRNEGRDAQVWQSRGSPKNPTQCLDSSGVISVAQWPMWRVEYNAMITMTIATLWQRPCALDSMLETGSHCNGLDMLSGSLFCLTCASLLDVNRVVRVLHCYSSR